MNVLVPAQDFMVLRRDAKQSLDRKVLVENGQELLMSVTLMLVGMVSAWLAVAFAMLWGVQRLTRPRQLFARTVCLCEDGGTSGSHKS